MRIRTVAGILLAALSANAQSPGTFTTVGNMITPRSGHTATLLPDGKVLIAGGTVDIDVVNFKVNNITATATAELFDPLAGTFTPTGNMATARAGHTATLLPNGTVLIAGGAASSVLSAEIYDPPVGTFTSTGNLSMNRGGHHAILLPNGTVLIAGGNGDGDIATEIYDPSTGTFSVGGRTNSYTATLLANGKVLITGILEGQLYDPATGAVVSTAPMTDWQTIPKAALLMNGKVLVAGDAETDVGGPYNFAELYDPVTATFARTGPTTTPRTYHTTTLLPDGRVLLTGGLAALSAEIYDPIAGAFAWAGDMSVIRFAHTATLLNDGKVFIAGGSGDTGTGSYKPISSTEIYTPQLPVRGPMLFSLSGDAKGPGAILHTSTQQIVTESNPAVAGEALEIYGSGLIDGSVIPPQVAIGGRAAEVLWFGNAPGYSGLNQINVRVPVGVAPGPTVPVRLNYLGRPSNQVTIGVQ
jgi:hypothetical protein